MGFQTNPYALPLFAGALIVTWLMLMTVQRRQVRGSRGLLMMLGLLLIYITGYALELSSADAASILTWLKIEYLGLAFLPLAVLHLVIIYLGQDRHPMWSGQWLLLLGIPAVVTILLAMTNEFHEAIWVDLRAQTWQGYAIAAFDMGYWYVFNVLYQYLVLAGALALLVNAYQEAQGVYKQHIAVIIAGLVMPALLSLVQYALRPEFMLDLTAYGLVITAVLLAWGVLNYRMFDVMPVARDTILQHMTDAVLVLDLQQRVVYTNPAARGVFPQEEEIIGVPIARLLPQWDDIQTSQAPGDADTTGEIVLQTGAARRYFDLQLSPLDAPGQCCLLLLRDITARKLSEEELRATNQRLSVLRRMDDELSRKLDPSYVAQIALDAAQRLSLADAGLILMHDEDDHSLSVLHHIGKYDLEHLGRAFAAGQGIAGRVLQHQRPEWVRDAAQDPDYIPQPPGMTSLIAAPLMTGRKRIGVLSLATRDPERFDQDVFEVVQLLAGRVAIALDNARMYDERAALVKELEAFAHTVAHDLKNPLYAITGFIDFVLNDPQLTEAEHDDFLQRIDNSAQKANTIIEALLLLAGLRRDGPAPSDTVDMNQMAREAHDRLRPIAEEHAAQITLTPDMPAARGFGPWIEEIWVNYLSNAIKYGGRPPHITLGYTPLPEGCIRYWVQDNGPGLTDDQQTQLFREFTRLDTQKIEGHGLGLSIVQRIAARLGGDVGVESAPGTGSRFWFSLPQAAPWDAPAPPPPGGDDPWA